MAKENNNSINSLAGGIITDTTPERQPPGTLRYALNAVDITDEGDFNAKSREEAFSFCGQLTPGYFPIEDVYLGSDSYLVFSANPTTLGSEIGITDKFCTYTPLINSACLNFSIGDQIDATYRLRRGCESTVYFVNGKRNPLRYVNISKLSDFYTDAYTDYIDGGSVGIFVGEIWDCEKFAVITSYSIPFLTTANIVSGGKTRSGTYNFAVRYLDGDLNPTAWIYASQIIDIYVDGVDNTNYLAVTGSSNLDVDIVSGTIETTKAIELTYTNLLDQYKYFQVAVCRATNGTGEVDKVLLIPPQLIENNVVIFDGILENYSEIPKEEILVKRNDIEYAEHIDQLENMLILAGTSGKQVEWCALQKYASKIASKYVVVNSKAHDVTSPGNSKNPDTYFFKEGYMGDDVYAMGIVYIIKGGVESPAYTIPARPKNFYYDFDTGLPVATVDDTPLAWSENLQPWYATSGEYAAADPLEKWRVFDTSVRYSATGEDGAYGAMQYHESRSGRYNPKQSCSDDDYWGVDCCGLTLKGEFVRHHKFPSRFKERITAGATSTEDTVNEVTVSISLKDEEVFPAGVASVIFIVNFENPIGTPQSIVVTIYPDTDVDPLHLKPGIYEYSIYTFTGDMDTFLLGAAGGTIIDDYSEIFDFTINVGNVSSIATDDTMLRNFGIQFANIEYPPGLDIIGHYFVRAERTEGNRTVLDKGIFGSLRSGDPLGVHTAAFSYFTHNNDTDSKLAYLFYPRGLFKKEILKPEYIKNETWYSQVRESYNAYNIDDPDKKPASGKENDIVLEVRSQWFGANFNSALGETNYKISKTTRLDTAAKEEGLEIGTRAYNLSFSQAVQLILSPRVIEHNSEHIAYASLKVDRDVHPNVENIKYFRMHNSMLTLASSQLVFGGDTFISELRLSNSLYRKFTKGIGMYIYLALAAVAIIIASIFTFGAASILGIALAIGATVMLAVTATLSALEKEQLDELTDDAQFNSVDENGFNSAEKKGKFNSYTFLANEILSRVYVESEINIELRQNQISHDCGGFFGGKAFLSDLFPYFRARWCYDKDDKQEWRKRSSLPCPEVYQYNLDYSRINKESQYFPLPKSYDCCSPCLESHPNRVAYSLQSFQEELTDNYKSFRVNDYRDIEGEFGPITDIIVKDSQLFIFTKEGAWILPQNYQERVTNELVSYIGTGEFFSIPPRPIENTEVGIMGTQHKWATLSLKEGIVIVSEIDGKIYMITQQGTIDMNEGNEALFRRILKDFFFAQLLQIANISYPYTNNPANPEGVGIHSTYDNKYKRILITKKDYELIFKEGGAYSETLQEGKITWNVEDKKFHTLQSGVDTVVSVHNKDFFEDKSWTISFSMKTGKPVFSSFHSYIPNFYVQTPNNLYSYIDNRTFKHNKKGLYNVYYGVSKPHILEYVSAVSPGTTKVWDDVTLQIISKKFDVESQTYADVRDVIFNKAVFYNSRQSTGELILVVKSTEADDETYLTNQIKDRTGEIIISRAERDWHINDIRDYRIDYVKPIFTQQWEKIKNNYPIDKVIDTDVVDFEKDWTQLESFRDKYLIIRLIADDNNDVQFNSILSTDSPNQSFR